MRPEYQIDAGSLIVWFPHLAKYRFNLRRGIECIPASPFPSGHRPSGASRNLLRSRPHSGQEGETHPCKLLLALGRPNLGNHGRSQASGMRNLELGHNRKLMARLETWAFEWQHLFGVFPCLGGSGSTSWPRPDDANNFTCIGPRLVISWRSRILTIWFGRDRENARQRSGDAGLGCSFRLVSDTFTGCYDTLSLYRLSLSQKCNSELGGGTCEPSTAGNRYES